MTEEHAEKANPLRGTAWDKSARTELERELSAAGVTLYDDEAATLADAVLDNLPLVLEAAREAGRAQLVHRALINGVGNDVWRLIPSGAEPTPPCSPETERDK